ncbi:MAG: alcohol dehydrogenase [Promethearchaeota archaeon]|nr:MAG: alcohol dehydrogenase [Candidatus Lokiarchaeota archaeon]
MRAAYIKDHGNLEQIQIGEVDIPNIRSNDVLIETKFGALNHLDLFVIRGWPGLELSMPHVIGADGSGIIKEIGSEVSTVSEGDRVTINPGISCGKCNMCLSGKQILCKQFSILGENKWGSFAEYIKVPETNVINIPDNYPFDKAAAAPLTFLTAWRMLTTLAKTKYNDIVFIHGAGGGVASAAIQIAKFFGAKVIATTSTQKKMEKAKELGADHVINYKEMKNFTKFVYTELTNRHGIDVVIDNVGQATFPTSIQLLRPGGKLITCGVTSGPFTKINITDIFWKHLEIKGSTMANQGEFREVMKLIFEGKLNPIIDKVFPLENTQAAEQYLSESIQFGKILIKVS